MTLTVVDPEIIEKPKNHCFVWTEMMYYTKGASVLSFCWIHTQNRNFSKGTKQMPWAANELDVVCRTIQPKINAALSRM
jgi:hypothetical protein